MNEYTCNTHGRRLIARLLYILCIYVCIYDKCIHEKDDISDCTCTTQQCVQTYIHV